MNHNGTIKTLVFILLLNTFSIYNLVAQTWQKNYGLPPARWYISDSAKYLLSQFCKKNYINGYTDTNQSKEAVNYIPNRVTSNQYDALILANSGQKLFRKYNRTELQDLLSIKPSLVSEKEIEEAWMQLADKNNDLQLARRKKEIEVWHLGIYWFLKQY